MLSKSLLLFFAVIILSACSTVPDKKSDKSEADNQPQKIAEEELAEKKLTESIILRDFYNKKNYDLYALSMGRPVFMVLTATWCEACKDLVKLIEQLNQYYKNSIFFVMVYQSGDVPDINDDSEILKMELVESLDDLDLESNDIYPRSIIFSRSGKEIEAVLDGIFPILVYHGILGGL
jgi:thiol-disulfide isomerase/thioredoxin